MYEKIAVFSDIHGNLQALQAILEDIKKEPIDSIICLGDVIGIGPNSKETLQLIEENKIEMILGNHEIYFLNNFKENEIFEAGKNHTEHHRWIASLLDNNDRAFLSNCNLSKDCEKSDLILSHFFLKNSISADVYPFFEIDIRKKENQNDVRIPNKRKYNLFGHIHNKFYFENAESKYYCLGSSGCVHDDKTFYNVIYADNKNVEIKEKIIKFNRDDFENSIQKVNYPEKQEIYNKFFKVL